MVLFAEQAAKKLSSEGISVEVIDPRTLSPLDDKSIIESVKKTGKLLIVDEANPYCSMASEVSSVVAEKAFYALKAPIRKITSPHTPVPASPTLEAFYVPSVSQIEDLARELSNC
jgi:pyruvate dehydrogenase E1 component beta subunit